MKNVAIKNIIESGKEAGACELLHDKLSLNALVKLLFKPQGIEFCQKQGFPYLEHLNALVVEEPELHKRGVYVDYGTIQTARKYVFAAGRSDIECVCRHAKYLYQIILAHGAHATIQANDYAVVNVYTIGEGCTYDIEADDTAVIFEHKK